MPDHAPKTIHVKDHAGVSTAARAIPGPTSGGESPLQAMVNGSPRVQASAQRRQFVSRSPFVVGQRNEFESSFQGVTQRRETAGELYQRRDHHSTPAREVVNHTGLPDELKLGIESLSGMSMDGVSVHHNSTRPAQMNALAYAQGSDIHLGPGQEQHLPHEAWHVVQQKQGRVKPSVQLKGGVLLNNDAGLESEADVMGEKAARVGAAGHEPGLVSVSTRNSATSAVQRKINFSGFGDLLFLPAIYEKIRAALAKNKMTLESLRKDKRSKDEPAKDELADLFVAIQDDTELIRLLAGLNVSPIDYGEINLDNPQHVILLAYDMQNYLGANWQAQREKDIALAEQKAKAQKEQSLEVNAADSPKNVYKVALLGTGASIAYYLTVNGRSLDKDSTVVIGKQQPWDPLSPESRAIGYINHPMHMISPLRTRSGISDEERFAENDKQLSDEIKEVINRFTEHQVNATIKSVKKTDNWYEIDTNSGVYHAQQVVAGLGIGPHQKPVNKSKDKPVKDPETVMDMDEFHRQLRDPSSVFNQNQRAKSILLGVSGPNAGVDVVKAATDKEYTVHWMVATNGPAIIRGMANEISRKKLVMLYFAYLDGWSVEGDGLKIEIGDPKPDNKKDNFSGWNVVNEKSSVKVDFLVYAPGPDVNKVYDLFSDEIKGSLKPKEDPSHRFDAPAIYDFRSTTNIGSSIWAYIEKTTGEKDTRKIREIFERLLNDTHKILEYDTFKMDGKERKSSMELATEDGSLKIIGGAAHRIRLLDKQELKQDRPLVSETLPPTDLIDDQLTPIRSQMEAMGNFMPGYIGTSESNFTTDDQTMISAQLASYYANIPPELANWITQKIIEERRDPKLGVRPGTEMGGRQFQDRWTTKLEELHKLYGSIKKP